MLSTVYKQCYKQFIQVLHHPVNQDTICDTRDLIEIVIEPTEKEWLDTTSH